MSSQILQTVRALVKTGVTVDGISGAAAMPSWGKVTFSSLDHLAYEAVVIKVKSITGNKKSTQIRVMKEKEGPKFMVRTNFHHFAGVRPEQLTPVIDALVTGKAEVIATPD